MSWPSWNSKVLPVAQRTPRRRMVNLANGYFGALQLNDGNLSCGEQFKTGSLSVLVLCHITDGRIDRIDAAQVDVPFGMPGVWRRDAD